MLEAALWGAVATTTLLVGMVLAYRGVVGPRWTGLLMAFGAGAIVSAAAYQLVLGSVEDVDGAWWIVAGGIAAGALTFYFADRWVDGLGGEHRLDIDGASGGGSGTGILLGSLLDGVPESLVLGLGLAHNPTVSAAFVFAVAISNVPQGLGGSAGMLASGWPKPKITRLWVAVCVLSVVAAVLGYGIAGLLPGATGAAMDAFAAGALLVMLTDSMIPEAFEEGGREAGLALVVGFGIATAMALAQGG